MIKIYNHKYNLHFKKILRHTLCWALFITYELSIFYISTGRLRSFGDYFFHYALNMGIFYCQFSILETTINTAKPQYVKAIALFLFEISIALIIKLYIDYLLLPTSKSFFAQIIAIKDVGMLNLFRTIYFAALASLYWAGSRISVFQKKAVDAEIRQLNIVRDNALLEAQLGKIQNAYLQQRLNPHLLFNSLNFIYGSVAKYSEKGADCVLLLTDILRFSLEDTDIDGKISLSDEIKQLQNLININQHRFNFPLVLKLLLQGNFDDYRIIPLVLLTLTENVLKHGNLKQPAVIRLEIKENRTFSFFSSNHKKTLPTATNKPTGLENIRLRLNYSYPDNYSLIKTENDTTFQLELNIKL